MKRINSAGSLPFKLAAVLAVALLVHGGAARGVHFANTDIWSNKYYDGSDFDLNDELSKMPSLKAAHRQQVTTAPTHEEIAGVIKNDEILPTNLFVTPDIMLNETHPKTESEGYLQVLQAMKYTPVVTEVAQAPAATTKNIQAKNGLNGALLKILTITKQFTSTAKPALTSSSVTINQIIQSYASMAFGNTYNEFNATAPVSNSSQVIYVAGPAQNKTIINWSNGTTTKLQGDYSVTNEGQVVPDANAEAEAQAEIPKRMLTLMRLYAEHVENKDKDIIADERHYGHIKSFDAHLNCLTDDTCDFGKHLSGMIVAGSSRNRHALESYMAAKTDIRSAHAAEYQSEVAKLIKALPGFTSNDEIKNATTEWIAKNQKYLSDFQANWPQMNAGIQSQLTDFKANLPMYQNLTPTQFLQILDGVSKSYKAKIDQEFTANGINDKVNELIELKKSTESLHAALKAVIPANGVLNADFNQLEQKLARHIAIFEKAKNATPEQLNAARIKLKNNLQMQINGVDPAANAEIIRSIANDADAIMKSDFGKSLNQDNLNFIVQKAINSFKIDFDQMKDSKKASGFMLDQADLQRLADDVVDDLKKSREANQKAVLNLKDFHKIVQEQNKQYSAQPNSGDAAMDAADLLISYENYYYNVLSSDDFYSSLQDYIARYYDVYHAHVVPLEPFFNYASSYKTLTAGLNNPNALGGLNPQAVRMLLKSGELQAQHLSQLSQTDKQFFDLFDHLTAEWAQTTDAVAFNRKLSNIILAVQGQSTGLTSAHLLRPDQNHMVFALFESVKNAIFSVIANLSTGSSATGGLINTITNGQNLVKNAAAQYQVADLLTGNSTSSGIIGGLKNKVKGWLGWRNLEIHYGLSDTISSVKNLWNSVSEAKDYAVKLQTTINEAQGYANNVKEGINVFNSFVGGKL